MIGGYEFDTEEGYTVSVSFDSVVRIRGYKDIDEDGKEGIIISILYNTGGAEVYEVSHHVRSELMRYWKWWWDRPRKEGKPRDLS